MPADKKNTLLVFSQVYIPDPAAVGQYMADTCEEMARRGWQVKVYSSRRGYHDPSIEYPASEVLNNVNIFRLPCSSFGKKNLVIRISGQLLFLAQCILRGLLTPRLGGIFIATSPPFGTLAALAVSYVRSVPIVYWAMDINPDQAIASGKFSSKAWPVRAFEVLNKLILSRASGVVTLDRFMKEKLLAKKNITDKLLISPTWPHEDYLEPIEHRQNPFRQQYHLEDKLVIMYSGNHTPVHPLNTVFDAIEEVKDIEQLVFMFIGDGLSKPDVENFIIQHNHANVLSVPYQPLESIKYSLSAADLHLVIMGDNMVGCVHPCKLYGALAVKRPILFIGPEDCHITDLLRAHNVGWMVRHGDSTGLAAIIKDILASDTKELTEKGQQAYALINQEFSKQKLCGTFCDFLEEKLRS